jgi:hypothetical protein
LRPDSCMHIQYPDEQSVTSATRQFLCKQAIMLLTWYCTALASAN